MMISIHIAATIKMQQLYVNVSILCYNIIHSSYIYYFFIYEDTNYTVDTSCNNGDVRLVGGINELERRVEICYNNI